MELSQLEVEAALLPENRLGWLQSCLVWKPGGVLWCWMPPSHRFVGSFACCAGWVRSPLSASDGLHATGQQVNPGELAALSKGREVALCECGWA